MKIAKRIMPLMLAAGLFSALSPAVIYAREKIDQVSLTFSLNTDNWSELNVECGDEGYALREVTLLPNGMEGTNVPCAVVVLDAEEDYYFSSIKEKYFQLEGEGAAFNEAARSNSNSTMTISVRLKDLGEGEMTAPTGLVWTDTGIASWDPVDGAGTYSVRIRKDGKAMGTASSPQTDITVYNLSTKITKTGNYTFQVRANGQFKKTKSSEWVESPVLVVDEAALAYIKAHAAEDTGSPGGWHEDETGKWYQYTTGDIPKSEWRQIEDYWYYFNESGYMVTDQWVDRYYVGSDGRMLTDTITPDGYYVDETGCWAPK